jgi:hypothetical protein
MTNPTKAVQIRRIEYSLLSSPLTAVLYDDTTDGLGDTDVLDRVLADDRTRSITGYFSDGTQNVAIVAPSASNVTSAKTNGAYNLSTVINVTVQFSETVIVVGTPLLTLETGATDRTASYVTGTNSNTLTFEYTVQAGDTAADLDYETVSSLALNGGSIKDTDGNDATLTLPAPGAAGSLGANKAIEIDTTAPTVTVNQGAAQADPTQALAIKFDVVFSESVSGITSGDFFATGTAIITGSTIAITGSGATYGVWVSGMGASGTVQATLAAGKGTDAAGNSNVASTFTDKTVVWY